MSAAARSCSQMAAYGAKRRQTMRTLRACTWMGAIAILGLGLGQASAADGPCDCGRPVVARPTCFFKHKCCYEPTTCCAPACECTPHRGPIRRFLHRVFHRHDCCPPPAVPVVPEAAIAVPPPVQILPPAGAPTVPPPAPPSVPPPGATGVPPASNIPPAVGSSYRPPVSSVPPVRFERLASYQRQ